MSIINFFRSWVVDLVIMFIFITILQLVLPSTNMKRYIDVIIGFLIILVVIRPFVKILSGDIKLEQNYLNRSIDNITVNYKEDEEFLNMHKEQIIDLYKKNLEEKIKGTVKDETEYKAEEVNLTIVEDDKDPKYGELIGVALTVNLDSKNEEIKENTIKVDEVKIKGKKGKNKSNENINISNEIKKIISKNYNVSKDNIEVFINKQLEGD